MKLQVVELSQKMGYVSIECLLPKSKEDFDVFKESTKNMDDDTRKLVETFMGPSNMMLQQMGAFGQETLLRIPIEWDDFQKLDLHLGDWIEFDIKKHKRK